MVNYDDNDIVIPVISALSVHLIFFVLVSYLINNHKASLVTLANQKIKPLQVKRISRQELNKFRTVGVKGGKKNVFTMPTKGDPNSKMKVDAQSTKKSPPPPNKLSFKNLKPSENIQVRKKSLNVSDLKIKRSKNIALPKVQVQSVRRQKIIKKDLMKQLGPGTTNAKIANKSDFQVHFETPEGVAEDELNSAEKIFYSFQKRSFESYFHAFLKSYNARINTRPALRKPLHGETHSLTGRVTFDKKGNIVSIKIMKWSQNDEVQDLFEETLKEIRSLPNPPKALLGNEEEFNIYYQLRIN